MVGPSGSGGGDCTGICRVPLFGPEQKAFTRLAEPAGLEVEQLSINTCWEVGFVHEPPGLHVRVRVSRSGNGAWGTLGNLGHPRCCLAPPTESHAPRLT